MITVNEDIKLVPAKVSHAPDIFRSIDENRNSLRVWLPFVDSTLTVTDTISFLESIPVSGQMAYVIRYRERFAGVIGFKSPDDANKKVEIGYIGSYLQWKGKESLPAVAGE